MKPPPRPAMRVVLALALSALWLTSGCDWPGKPDPAGRPVPPDKVLDFAALYKENCSGCHGAEGKLGPAPPLNDPLFLSIVPDAELLRVIREGRPGTPMPPFAKTQGGSLTDAQVLALAEGVKRHWGGDRDASPEKVPPYLAPGRGSPKRGKEVFARACAVCHGDQGKGNGDEGESDLRINDPAFLALISDQALRRFVITGRPDLGMPDFAGKRPGEPDFQPLTGGEVTDLVALLASWAPERPGHGKGESERSAQRATRGEKAQPASLGGHFSQSGGRK